MEDDQRRFRADSHPTLSAETAAALRDPSRRHASGLALVDGIRLCWAAWRAGYGFRCSIRSRRLLKSASGRELADLLAARDVPELRLGATTFRGVITGDRASGLAAVVHQRWARLDEVERRPGLWLACGQLDRPGNLGTLLRTAQSLGAAGVIFLGDGGDPYDPDVMRASMGAVFHLPHARCRLAELGRFARGGWRIVGTSAHGAQPLHRLDLRAPSIVLLGNERTGMTPAERSLCGTIASIPMSGECSSLNVGVAGSLIVYEAWRQRQPACAV